MTANTGPPNNINVSGKVVEVLNRYKAVVEFVYQGTKHRALLKVEKLTNKSNINPDLLEDHAISEFVKIGTVVKFLCHTFDISGKDRCGWYVADVQALDPVDLTGPGMLGGNICLCPTMFNKTGFITKIDKRQGVITFIDDSGNKHDILLLASKLYIHWKRVNVKQSLENVISQDDKIHFDAVPIDPAENDNQCDWFATLAWTHSKPPIDYDSPPSDQDKYLSQIKMLTKNPKSQFIRGVGQVMQILNEEYGIALGAVNSIQTHWQSILFHRSCVSLFKFNLGETDLKSVFKEGDKIKFIAAESPKGFSAQWVASHISIDVVEEALSLEYDFS